jgi:hypothetical protein
VAPILNMLFLGGVAERITQLLVAPSTNSRDGSVCR